MQQGGRTQRSEFFVPNISFVIWGSRLGVVSVRDRVLPKISSKTSSVGRDLRVLSVTEERKVASIFTASRCSGTFPGESPRGLEQLQSRLVDHTGHPIRKPRKGIGYGEPVQV